MLEDEVRSGDRIAYLAHLFAPESVRPALHALAAYRLELKRIVARARDPLAAEIRLQWWRDAVRNQGHGAVAGVPLLEALRQAMARYHWPADVLATISEAHIHDLYADPFPTLDEFDGYAGETAGAATQLAVMALAIDVRGEADGLAAARGAAAAAGYAGVALTAAEAVRSFAAEFARGRTLMPAALWESTTHTELSQALTARSVPPRADAAVRALAEHGLAADRQLRALLPPVAAPARVAFLPALTATPMLERARRDPLRASAPPQWRLQWTLWRAARGLRRLGGASDGGGSGA